MSPRDVVHFQIGKTDPKPKDDLSWMDQAERDRFERWVEAEVIPTYDELEKDPSQVTPLEEILAARGIPRRRR